jgi:cytochrome c556
MALSACSGEPEDTLPGQPVAHRRQLFKQFTRTLEPMGMVARERKAFNRSEFFASAQELQQLARQPWHYFTPDSNYPPTHAKAEVWLKSGEFQQAQDAFQAKANELAAVARSGNLEEIRAAVNNVERSCKSCHKQFRNDG